MAMKAGSSASIICVRWQPRREKETPAIRRAFLISKVLLPLRGRRNHVHIEADSRALFTRRLLQTGGATREFLEVKGADDCARHLVGGLDSDRERDLFPSRNDRDAVEISIAGAISRDVIDIWAKARRRQGKEFTKMLTVLEEVRVIVSSSVRQSH